MQRYLGIDYGSARMGLAIGDSEVKIAHPHATISAEKLVETLANEGPFVALVLGLPRSLDGRETAQSLAVRRYADDELSKLGLDIIFQDEAGTSSIAEERLRESGKKYTREDIDTEAATIILQDFLNSL